MFALTDQEGKLFHPLAFTKTFAITASAILALTVVPVLSYYLLKPIQWSRRRSLSIAAAGGVVACLLAGLVSRGVLGLGDRGPWSGWLIAAALGFGVAAVIYRMTRERLLPLEENWVSRKILSIYVPTLRWVLNHKKTFLAIPIAVVFAGLLAWLGFGRLMAPVEAGFAKLGVPLNQNVVWSKLTHAFPGVGREFMPALDEGSLVYMPSLVPAGSLSAALEVVSTQDRAIRTVPEVESVVGKLGRAD